MIFIYKPFLLTIVLILILFFVVYLLFQLAHPFEYWSKRYVPYLKPSFPFGNFNRKLCTESGLIIRDIYNELKKSGAKYGGYYVFGKPFFLPLTPELYKDILIKNFNSFHDLGIYFNEANDPLSASIVALKGHDWKYIRTKLSPVFSSVKLKMMFPIMQKCSSDLSTIMQNEDKIEIHDLATRYTTDMICSCAFGFEDSSLKNPNAVVRKYGRMLVEMSFLDSFRLAMGLLTPGILEKFNICLFNPKITKFFHSIVEQTIEYREKNNVKRNDLMEMLIRLKNNEAIEDDIKYDTKKNENEEGLTVNQIAAEVFFFYLAGFETTAMALTFCMYELARHPDIQQKVRNEIVNVIQENGGEITFDGIKNMPYTDKVLQETLRMYPPILMVNRICTQQYSVPGTGLTIEEGTRVVISTLGVHYDPDFYPHPERFDPERFSDQEKAKRPPMTYFPFSDGPRICLGQNFALIEIKLALTEFLKNYEYAIHPSTKPNIRILSNSVMLGLKDKIWLTPSILKK